MPLLMLISGYLFAYSVKGKRWDVVIWTKCKQLLLPLAGWSVVYTLIAAGKTVGGEEVINALWIIRKLIEHFIYGPWFLWAVWWCSLVITLVRRFFKDCPWIYLLGTLLTFVVPDGYNLYLYKFMWPFFLLAYWFHAYDYQTKWEKLHQNKGFICSVVVVFLLLLPLYNYHSYIYITEYNIIGKNALKQIYLDVYRFLIGMAGSLTAIYLVRGLLKVLPEKIKSCAAFVGRNTLGIYIISDIIFTNVLLAVTAGLEDVSYCYVAVETVAVLLLSLGINEALKRIPVTNKLLLGGR